MNLPANPNHPIYGTIRYLGGLTSLTLILLFTASKFDYTELRTIAWMIFAAGGIEGGVRWLQTRGNDGATG